MGSAFFFRLSYNENRLITIAEVNMIQDLEYLIQLQEIDLRIKEQEIAKEQFPAMVSELEAQINKAQDELQSAQDKHDWLKKELSDAEEQTTKAQESLDKSQERLSTIKTNREYDAVHKEIEAQKHLLSGSEGKKKTISDEIEKQAAAVEESSSELNRIKSELEPQIQELNAKIGAIDSNIDEITAEREAVLPKISKPTLRTYESIRKKRKTGRALSLVNSSKVCTVCFKVLEPQLYNEIRRGTKIILCESCGSIYVWNENPTEQK